MKIYRYIASKIQTKTVADRKISSMSSKIGLISVSLSIFVIIAAVCIVRGFRNEIRFKTSGYMGDIAFVSPGQTPINETYPFEDSISIIDDILAKPYVKTRHRAAN